MTETSSFERGRDPRRKKLFSYCRDKEDKNYGSKRLPIILTKADGEGKTGKSKLQETLEKPLSQPTIILRNRDGENRAVSPNQRATARVKKENDAPAPLYHLAAKHSTTENTNALALPIEMKSPVKLIDDQFQILDGCLEFLTEQTDFVVIGCVGFQGVGKSTLMSHLAGSSASQLSNTIFKTETYEQQRESKNCTTGIDFYITRNRVIFLDCQPLLSSSMMIAAIQDPKSLPSTLSSVDSISVENSVEIQALQLIAFLMSVCHVVLLVQDWFFDPNLIRFIQTAAMLKPVMNTSADDMVLEYFPQLMFVQTHCTTSEFTAKRVKIMQEAYKQSFSKSLLQLQSGLGIANGGVIAELSPAKLGMEPINLFLLPPLVNPVPGHFQGHPGYEELVVNMRQQLQGIVTNQLTTSQLTEKHWLHYATKVLENIKKSTFFQEYARLLP